MTTGERAARPAAGGLCFLARALAACVGEDLPDFHLQPQQVKFQVIYLKGAEGLSPQVLPQGRCCNLYNNYKLIDEDLISPLKG